MQSLKERTLPALSKLQQFAFCLEDFRHLEVKSKIFTFNEQSKYLFWTLAQQGAADPLDGSIAHQKPP